MIRDTFIVWIAFQLIVIGLAGGLYHAQINNGTIDCVNKKEHMYEFSASMTGAMLPLIFFTNVDSACDKKELTVEEKMRLYIQ